MAKKVLVNRTQFTSTLKNELYEELRTASSRTGIPLSRLLDWAVEGLLERPEITNARRPVDSDFSGTEKEQKTE